MSLILENRVKKELKEGKTVIGTMIAEFGKPEIIRLLSAGGFDFAMVDMEHSPFSLETVAEIVRASKSTNLTLLARVPTADYFHVARTLDSGVHGIMIPHIEDVTQVKMAVDATKYPPQGQRSYGVRPIITDYRSSTLNEQIASLNANTMVIIQIESQKAVDDIEKLVSVPGVDAALIGSNDLSMSLGCPGELNHPKMDEAITRVIEACRKYNVVAGNHLRNLKSLLEWREKGMRMLMYSTDSDLLLSASKDAVRKLRGEQGPLASEKT